MLDVRGWDDVDSHYDDRLLAIIGSLPGFDPCVWVSKEVSGTIEKQSEKYISIGIRTLCDSEK